MLYRCVLLVLCLLPPVHAGNSQEPVGLRDLMQEAGLTYLLPADYLPIQIDSYPQFPHELAIEHRDKLIQVRYSIRPLSRIEIDYEDPHNAAPEPNHIFTMIFTSLIGHLSIGGNTPHREYSTAEAQEKFNADWAALSLFDVDPEYSRDYRHAFLLAIHKNNLSDAYLVILFNDLQTIKPMLDEAMTSLTFDRG